LTAARLPRRALFVLVVASALAATLTSASLLSARDEPEGAVAVSIEPSPFAGIAQRGAALGSPDAPVTLVEYADLQCPYCAQWSRDALPALVDEYVRDGRLRIVFHGLAFIGPDSETALRTAVAAGRQRHLWDVVHGLYERQGAENDGWVTDALVREIAAGVPALDPDELLRVRWTDVVEPDLARAAAEATRAGITGTPSFQLGHTGGALEVVSVTSLGPEGIAPAIEDVLRG
jgi:protein-disulfide isomerase